MSEEHTTPLVRFAVERKVTMGMVVLGVLVLGSHREGVFTENVERTLRTIEPHVATVVDSARHYQRLLEQEARTSLSSLFE